MPQPDLPYLGFSTRTRKSPYYDATRRWGAKGFTIYNHMLMPVFYESPEADYWKLINNVTFWDVAVERQVEITGPDAAYLAQLMTPRNLSKCKIGQCMYVPITAEDGGIINDPVLLKLGENHFWLSLADSDVLLWARGIAYGRGLNVDLIEPDVSPLAIQGPNYLPVMEALFGTWVKDVKFFWFRETELDGIPLVVARSGWSKQGGFELYLRDGRYGDELWERVAEAGKPYNIAPATPSTIERIEGGLLSYGNDMSLQNNPLEVGLDKYCDLDQAADFIGKDALRRIKAEGIRQKLVGVELHGPRIPNNEHHWPLRHNETAAGKVTSSTYSPRLRKNIALAMVPIELAAVGTQLTAESPFGPIEATVQPIPFIP